MYALYAAANVISEMSSVQCIADFYKKWLALRIREGPFPKIALLCNQYAPYPVDQHAKIVHYCPICTLSTQLSDLYALHACRQTTALK